MSNVEKGKEVSEWLDDIVQDERIVDADFHLHVPDEELADYIENDTVRDAVKDGGTPPSALTFSPKYTTSDTEYELDEYIRPQGIAIDKDEIRKVGDEMGVSEIIVTPGTHLGTLQGKTRYPPVQREMARAYNEYVVDHVLDVENGIYATLVLPPQNPDAAVEELDRHGDEAGFVGAQGYFNHQKLWGVPENDPIFERLVDLNLPLLLHISGTENRFTLMEDSMRSLKENLLSVAAYACIGNVVNMICTGVFDKYPDLNVVMQEAGVGWIPYIAQRADEFSQGSGTDITYTERMLEMDQDGLERLPSEYIFDNVYVTTQPIALPQRSDLVEAFLKLCRAEEMFIFSTDWPHSTVDAPNWLFEHRAIDDELRSQITHGNAETVFRLPE